jgi:Uma2 family endonuclease
VLLLIEVADTSLDYDRSVKRPLYAEAGITEYWIANLLDQVIEVHRLPDAVLGTYQHMEILARGQQVEALAFPGEIFQVNDLL